jgi:hypothetical protein
MAMSHPEQGLKELLEKVISPTLLLIMSKV